MKREEALADIEMRLQKPENHEKYVQLTFENHEGFGLLWHYNRLTEMLGLLQKENDPVQQRIYEDSFDSSLREIAIQMSRDNWK